MVQTEVSSQSRRFVDDLRTYLFSCGKNEHEIREIVEELETHLYEAELNGKSTEDVVGHSPKAYMESISDEMKTEHLAWFKYLPLLFLGGMSYMVFGDLLDGGTLSYSVLVLGGTIIYALVFFISIAVAFRYISKNQLNKVKELVVILVPVILSMLFIGGIFLLDLIYSTPMIHFGVVGSVIAGVIVAIFIVAVSIWSKTLILPITLLALYLPQYLLSFTQLNQETQIGIGFVITYGVMGAYLFYMARKAKKMEASV